MRDCGGSCGWARASRADTLVGTRGRRRETGGARSYRPMRNLNDFLHEATAPPDETRFMTATASSLQRGRPGSTVTGWAATALVLAAVIGLGAWGVTAPRGEHDQTAAVGENVSIPGGLARVDVVREESMGKMAMSGPGMSMPMTSAPGTAVPDPPKGFHRVSVDLTLVATSGLGLRFSRSAFRVGPFGTEGAPAVGIDTGPSVVPPGLAASRSVSFDVPDKAQDLVLTVQGSHRPIRLGIGAAATHTHDHSHDHTHG
jgi:hypothetical protein